MVDLIAAERERLVGLIEQECRKLIDWVEADHKKVADLFEWNNAQSQRLITEVSIGPSIRSGPG